MNGIYMDEDYNVLNTIDANSMNKLVGGYDKFILKPSIDSCSGVGVSLFQKQGNIFIDQNQNAFSFDFLEKNYGDDFILQECVEQSEYLSQFNPTSINTIRTVVYRSVKDNSLHVTNAIIRIGANKAVVDNAHSGGKFCGIDKQGNLGKYVCETFGEKSVMFNDIDFEKSNFRIPDFDKIIEFSKDIVKEIPHHRLVALDIAVDKNNNPILIEYNIGGFSYWLFQFSGQVAIEGFTDEVIEYCKKHKSAPILNIKI